MGGACSLAFLLGQVLIWLQLFVGSDTVRPIFGIAGPEMAIDDVYILAQRGFGSSLLVSALQL